MKLRTLIYTLASFGLLLVVAWLALSESTPPASAGEPWEIRAGEALSNAPNTPPLPFSPYGTVKINGANVSEDTIISAGCNGDIYDDSLPGLYEGETWYGLVIPGDDPGTSEVEGCGAGDAVSFFIGPHQADQSASWNAGLAPQIDLTVLLPTDTPTPTATTTPTPTPTMTATSTPTPTPTGTAVPTIDEGGVYLPFLNTK